MARLKCKKCGNVFEQNLTEGVILGPHIGPYRRIKCPACGKRSWLNIYSSVKEPDTWPPNEKKAEQSEEQLSAEELEKKQIEESKYERA